MRISDWSSDVCSSDLPCQGARGIALVERDVARDPAVAEILVIEGIEQARPAHIGESEQCQRADMLPAEAGFEATDKRRVRQQTIKIEDRKSTRLNSSH